MKIDTIITDVLGLDSDLFIQKSGNLKYYDYEKYWIYGEIKLYYTEKSDTPSMIQFSGSGWAFYKDNYLDAWEVTEFGYIKFLDNSFGHLIEPKRLDMRLDDFNDKAYYTPKTLLNYCQKRRLLYGRSTIYKPFGDDFTGRTLYLGAAVRDPARGCDPDQWRRQLRGLCASLLPFSPLWRTGGADLGVHGLRPAGGDCGQVAASRPGRGLHGRRRLPANDGERALDRRPAWCRRDRAGGKQRPLWHDPHASRAWLSRPRLGHRSGEPGFRRIGPRLWWPWRGGDAAAGFPGGLCPGARCWNAGAAGSEAGPRGAVGRRHAVGNPRGGRGGAAPGLRSRA
jgi:hypothetical protein